VVVCKIKYLKQNYSYLNIIADKLTQAGLNQLPFISALFFLKTDYLVYYKLLTAIFLFNAIGNLGLERSFASKNLNITDAGKKILIGKILLTILYVFWAFYLFEFSKRFIVISSLIVLTNISTFGEYLYIGNHIKRPLIVLKIVIVISGLILRYLYRDVTFYVYLLLIESLIYLISLLSLIRLNNSNREQITLKTSGYIYSIALLLIAFLVTKIYIFGVDSAKFINLKFIHYFDYLVFISGLIGSFVLKRNDKYNLSNVLFKLIIINLILVVSSTLINQNEIYYIVAKIISAINVFIMYVFLAQLNIKDALVINIPSLFIMSLFLFLSLFVSLNVFVWMMYAEFSVSMFLFLKTRNRWYFSF
jgi:hypothetical protein